MGKLKELSEAMPHLPPPKKNYKKCDESINWIIVNATSYHIQAHEKAFQCQLNNFVGECIFTHALYVFLPRYIKATQLIYKIFKVAGYVPCLNPHQHIYTNPPFNYTMLPTLRYWSFDHTNSHSL